MIKELTNVAISIVREYYNDYKENKYDLEEAQRLALEKIRKISYGKEKKDYFWIMDMKPVVLMHPYVDTLEGKNIENLQNEEGVPVFKDAVTIVKLQGEGYIHYNWQWKDDPDRILPKISFVKLFKEWEWIIGTGIYIDDIETEIHKIRKDEYKIAFLIICLFLIFMVLIVSQSIKIERKRHAVYEKLVSSEEKFRKLFHNSNDIIIISDTRGEIHDVNNKVLKKYDYKKEEIIGKKTLDFIPIKYHALIIERIQKIKMNNLTPIEIEFALKNNVNLNVEINSSVFHYKGKDMVISIIRNITERKQHEHLILNAMITGEESERARMAKELHDGLGPYLSTLKMYFQWLGETDDKHKRTVILDKGNQNIKEAITILREISNNLNPHILINYGLMEAIRSFCSKINESNKITIDFTPLKQKIMNYQIELALYRVIIELINNTLKHAQASLITINFEYEMDKWIKMMYTDDGIGFEYAPSALNHAGFGLINIQNRIDAVNGKISFETSPGKGLNIIAYIKLNQS